MPGKCLEEALLFLSPSAIYIGHGIQDTGHAEAGRFVEMQHGRVRLVQPRERVPGSTRSAHGWFRPILNATPSKNIPEDDVAIDQSGCFKTSKPTTHAAPRG
ncbi:MAG: hypothetical protein HOB98_01810 [Gammaproteobacteria bacterium]|nr:hypothetical protein [Gammaproteobacteria bacterium]MBT3870834.1 hypothetical protein [Gammaproteobacteria bacterium]MBT4378112.1 hypothetical protein [Gammaproteobacteria bacterium]MBT4615164.1 hypothetical protein [Gammaproteobacteria bacterium]MBT5199034.1 hypothetical protein [Gammaproteobacteria bacterium]